MITFAGNLAWVDASNGNDSTAVLRSPDKPYATIAAAFTAIIALGGEWTVHIAPGAYTDTGLVPQGAAYNITTVWAQGARWNATGSGYLFDLSTVTSAKPWRVLGRGRFYGSNTQTGGFVTSAYAVTVLEHIDIEAEKISPGSAVTNFIDLRGHLTSSDPVNSDLFPTNQIRVGVIGSGSGSPLYFRLGGTTTTPFIYVHCNYIGGAKLDEGNFMIRAGYAEAIQLAPNAFTNPSLLLDCVYRLKGTNQPALLARRGIAIIRTPNIEVTDGNAAAIQIPPNADTLDGVHIGIFNSRFKQWAGGSSPAIDFAAVNSKFEVRLIGCHFLMANTATYTIRATGAQTIEGIGSLTSTLALDPNVSVRGATPLIDSSFWTDF